ncbi:P-loop containing nucleoside triphosphate hydrolase protein [Hypoxylon rubiginosum]|uniref:P-loop containing nucleoside triphosphate hydrolase protein n=1 Tax=Hypoxylon rubiginosum TaxID=110542 RepID=A0ACB9Z0Q7_9PEZI|nr:P-loop containing nucleoside triphosphate hydrolase protein [Hypoxylon rubiginosum]
MSTMDTSDTESVVEHSRGQQVRMILDSSSASWSELGSEVSSSDEDDSADHEGPGQVCDVKKLYEGETKCNCCVNWVEELPEDMGPSAEEESESRRHALLIRLRRNHSDGKPMVLHSIVIQSSYLKSILGQVFQEYSGITTTLKKLVFKAPFHCFFYEWHRLEKIVHEIDDPVRKSHARLLRRIIRSELKETISLSNDLSQNGVITFDYLWTIFKPGIDIYTFEDGYDRIYRLHSAQYASGMGTQFFQMTVHEIDCEGDGFGYQWKVIPIHNFPGTRQIQDLDAFPATCHPRIGEVKEALKKRGEMFRMIHLKPYYYGAYKGIVIDGKHKRNVDGRIVVDPSSYATFTDGVTGLIPFDSSSLKQGMDVSDQTHQPAPQYRGAAGRPMPPPPPNIPNWGPHPPPPPPPQIMLRSAKYGAKYAKRPELTDDMLHLCSAYVRGYCFKIKKWVTFHIDNVREIQWHDGAFDSLVLAGQYKKLITAFVESHVENKDRFDDVIEGKGQGITMLLEGPPGVGKTLTAEAVSEKLRRPLYVMGAGELGADPESVEESLSMILEAAAKWDAVLLLDECDVLLAQRSSDNLGRNSIVAIFLRLLEYYRGMLFMTTNRVEAIDPAFQSRIHLTIRYPSLDAAARRQIWERFVRTPQQESTLQPQDFLELQSVDVNGREIKNLVKTAQLLASHEKVPLAIEHIRTALSVSSASAHFPIMGFQKGR